MTIACTKRLGREVAGLLEKSRTARQLHNQANQLIARNLKGKLLLAHGTMDATCRRTTRCWCDELIKANKDFDLLMLPNRGHGFGNEPYMVRRWITSSGICWESSRRTSTRCTRRDAETPSPQ